MDLNEQVSEWMRAELLCCFRDTVDAPLFLSSLPHLTPLHPPPPFAFQQESYTSSFGFAEALQTVSFENVPLSSESISYWAASTEERSRFLYHFPVLCALERILNVCTKYMLKYSWIYSRRFFCFSPLYLKIEHRRQIDKCDTQKHGEKYTISN